MDTLYKNQRARAYARGFEMIACALIVAGCSVNSGRLVEQHRSLTVTSSDQSLVKGAMLPGTDTESTPIEFGGGLLYVVSHRDGAAPDHAISIRFYDAQSLLLAYELPTPLGYISAFKVGKTLYITGTDHFSSHGNSIWIMSTQNLIEWSEPVKVIRADSHTVLANSSVTQTPAGFVMAYEICRDGEICFNTRFLTSADLVTWTDTGNQLELGFYTACPTIRYVDGYYYVFYLSNQPQGFMTLVSRSKNLVTWEQSPRAVVAPDGPDSGSGNASDFDLVELNGVTHALYSVSPQSPGIVGKTYGIRQAIFNGTISQFLQGLFQ